MVWAGFDLHHLQFKARLVAQILTFIPFLTLSILGCIYISAEDHCHIRRNYSRSSTQCMIHNPLHPDPVATHHPYASDIFVFPVHLQEESAAWLGNDEPLNTVNHVATLAKCLPLYSNPPPNKNTYDCDLSLLLPPSIVSTFPESMRSYFQPALSTTLQELAPAYVNLILNFASGKLPGGVFPNLMRCIASAQQGQTTELQSKIDVQHWRDIGFMSESSARIGACTRTGLPNYVETSGNYLTPISIFSSIHIMYLLTTVMWISASFALFYVACFAWPQSWMSYAVLSVCMIWNVVWFFTTMIWANKSINPIPPNNVLVGFTVTILACIFQGYTFFYIRRDESNSPNGERIDAHARVKLQCMEYVITTPLLFVVILAAVSPSVPTSVFQAMAILLAASHIASCTGTIAPDAEHSYATGAKKMCMILLVLCTFLLQTAALILFLNYTANEIGSFTAENTAISLSADLFVVFEIAFGVVLLATSVCEVLNWNTFSAFTVPMYIFLDLTSKLIAASIIYNAMQNNHIAAHTCSPLQSTHHLLSTL
jgi:hypothetical protein